MLSLTAGDTTQFSTIQQNQTCYGDILEPFTVSNPTWSSTDPSVASCDSTGLATAQLPGFTHIQSRWTVRFWDSDFDGMCHRYLEQALVDALCDILPRLNSVSPDRALIGNPVDVTIRGIGFGLDPTVDAGAGIGVVINYASGTEIRARFNISINDAGGNHGVFVTTSTGKQSNGGNFFVQKPDSLVVLSVNILSPGTPGGCGDYGVRVAVRYQVYDQGGQLLRSSQMEPKETLTNFIVDGVSQAGSPGLSNIGPSEVPGTSQFSDENGQFLDAPFGFCPAVANTYSIRQQIFIVAGGFPYIVRVNEFSGSSSAPGSGTITNGLDIQASR